MCAHVCLSSRMSVLLTSVRRLKASVKATSNIPMPWANSLSRCSLKCWENKVWVQNIMMTDIEATNTETDIADTIHFYGEKITDKG